MPITPSAAPVPALEQLLRDHPLLWRNADAGRAAAPGLATGFPALDAALPGGGWPVGALVEIVTGRWGSGELRLLLPALAAISRSRRLAWVAPPLIPYAPALAAAGMDLARTVVVSPAGENPKHENLAREILWAAEKLLASPCCGMVLVWPPVLRLRDARRLQLAAQSGGGTGVVFRQRNVPSPAALRLAVQPRPNGLRVEILKTRGYCRQRWVELP